MKLEEAIKQTTFQSDYQKATLNLMYTNNWLVNQIRSLLKGYGITMQQYNVLRILRGQFPNPISTAAIRERMLDKMSDASRIVDRLYKKRLLKRNTCPNDKRLVDVVVSKKGLTLLKLMDREVLLLDELLSPLSCEEVKLLNHLLDKIREGRE